MTRRDGQVELAVRDNGSGFDPAAPHPGSGLRTHPRPGRRSRRHGGHRQRARERAPRSPCGCRRHDDPGGDRRRPPRRARRAALPTQPRARRRGGRRSRKRHSGAPGLDRHQRRRAAARPVHARTRRARRARRARDSPHQPAVVVLTSATNDEHLVRAVRAGATSYLLKTAAAEDVIAAVRAAATGTRQPQPRPGDPAHPRPPPTTATRPAPTSLAGANVRSSASSPKGTATAKSPAS